MRTEAGSSKFQFKAIAVAVHFQDVDANVASTQPNHPVSPPVSKSPCPNPSFRPLFQTFPSTVSSPLLRRKTSLRTHVLAIVLNREDVAVECCGPLLTLHGHLEIA